MNALPANSSPLTPADFDYSLPEELVAQRPSEPRDACRLMHFNRSSGQVGHRRFTDLPTLLKPGDLLILNDTRVVPARFWTRRPTGGRVEGLFLREQPEGAWNVLLRNAERCKVGERLMVEGGEQTLVIESRLGAGEWTVRPDPGIPADRLLEQVGVMPLPPYIHRPSLTNDPQDRQRYQTVYARTAGAVAAPTAGLHFTTELFAALEERGIHRAYVTLHVGLGTFLPVKAGTLAEHQMHSEWYDLPEATVQAIQQAGRRGGRVVAVGTTAIRVLESAARNEPLQPCSGWTDIFLYPPAEFRVTDALITNFHLPASTLIMLVAAFCSPGELTGREMILSAYRQAVAQRYAFYSYGDAMLID